MGPDLLDELMAQLNRVAQEAYLVQDKPEEYARVIERGRGLAKRIAHLGIGTIFQVQVTEGDLAPYYLYYPELPLVTILALVQIDRKSPDLGLSIIVNRIAYRQPVEINFPSLVIHEKKDS
jgi:hypothetical protein